MSGVISGPRAQETALAKTTESSSKAARPPVSARVDSTRGKPVSEATPQAHFESAGKSAKPVELSGAQAGPEARALQAQVVAQVGGHPLTRDDLLQEAVQRNLLDVDQAFVSFAREQLRLVPERDESPEAFEARVWQVASATGRASALEETLSARLAWAQKVVLEQLAAQPVFAEELRKRNIELPEAQRNDVAAMADVLAGVLATESSLPPDDARVTAMLRGRVDAAVWDALREPHAALLRTAFAGLAPDAASLFEHRLFAMYRKHHGLDAFRQVASELATGGNAQRVAELLRKTGTVDWSVQTLAEVAKEPGSEWLAPLVAPLVQEAGNEAVLTPSSLELDGQGNLTLQRLPNPVVDELKRGTRKAAWTQDKLSLSIDRAGDPAELKRLVAWTSEHLNARVSQLVQRLPEASKQSGGVATALKESGLLPFLGKSPETLLLSGDPAQLVLRNAVVDQKATGQSHQAVAAQLEALGLPKDQLGQLEGFLRQFEGLAEHHPLPKELEKVLQGDNTRPVVLQLEEGRPLDAREQESLTALQRYLVFVDELKEGQFEYGRLNGPTVNKLRGLSPDARNLVLNQELTRRLLASVLSVKVSSNEKLTAELLLKHPAVRRHLSQEGEHVDPIQLGLEYLKATQPDLGLNPLAPQLDGRFYAALARSAQAPVNERALTSSVGAVKGGPALPPDVRQRLLASTVSVSGKGANLSYVPTGVASGEALRKLSAGLEAESLPQGTRAIARADEGLVGQLLAGEVRLSRPGMDALPDVEPVAALRLVAAKLSGAKLPVDADHTLDAVLTAEDLRVLQRLRGEKETTGQPGAGRGPREQTAQEAWKRVIEAVERGEVTLSTLDDVPESQQLDSDVNRVLADLREMAQVIKMTTVPKDRATVRTDDQKAAFRGASERDRPVQASREILASALGQKASAGSVSAADVERLQRLAANVEQSFPKQRTDGTAQRARAFAKQVEKAGPLLDEVKRALAAKPPAQRLTLEENQPLTEPRNPQLEAKADEARRLLVEGADVLMAEASERNDWSLAQRLHRGAIGGVNHLFRMPGFSDTLVFNTVSDWTLVALKGELAGQPKELLQAQDVQSRSLIDAGVVGRLAKQDKSLAGLAQAMAEGRVKPFDPRTYVAFDAFGAEGGAPRPAEDADPELEKAKRTAIRLASESLQAARQSALAVDARLISHLVAAHPDAIGKSRSGTVLSGVPVPLPDAETAKKLLLRVATRMGTGHWNSLNISLDDSKLPPEEFEETITAKALVQEALARLGQESFQGGAVVPLREGAPVKAQAAQLLSLSAEQLAPYLKGAAVLAGHVRREDAGELTSPVCGPAMLAAAANLALDAAVVAKELDREMANALLEDRKVLDAAAAAGKTVAIDGRTEGASDPEVGKALRRVAAFGTQARGARQSSGSLGVFDFTEMLQGVEALQVRSPLKNRVHRAETPGTPGEAVDLEALVSRAGSKEPDSAVLLKKARDWAKHLQLDPQRALETGVASGTLFSQRVGLMRTMIHYQFQWKPAVELAKAAGEAHEATTSFERKAAADAANQAVQEVVNLSAMMTAFAPKVPFVPPLGPAEDVAYEVSKGHLDVASGKAVAFYYTMPGLALGTALLAQQGYRGLKSLAHKQHLALKGATEHLVAQKPELYEAKAVGVRGHGNAPSTARVAAARTYQTAGLIKDVALAPRLVSWDAPLAGLQQAGDGIAAGVDWLRGRTGLKKQFVAEPTQGGFRVAVSEADKQWMSTRPEARIQVPLSTVQVDEGGRVVGQTSTRSGQVDVSVRQLYGLADSVGQTLSPEKLKELGIAKLNGAQEVGQALARLGKSLPPMVEPAPGSAAFNTSLKELLSTQKGPQAVEWNVARPRRGDVKLELSPVKLLELLDAQKSDPSGAKLERLIQNDRALAGESEEVRRVLKNFEKEYAGWGALERERLRTALRGAKVTAGAGGATGAENNAGTPANAIGTAVAVAAGTQTAGGEKLLMERLVGDVTLSVFEGEKGEFVVKAKPKQYTNKRAEKEELERIKKKELAYLEQQRATYGTNATQTVALVTLREGLEAREAALKALDQQAPAANASAEEKAAHQARVAEARKDFNKVRTAADAVIGSKLASELPTIKARLEAAKLRARLYAHDLTLTWRERGAVGVGARVVTSGTAATLKSPGFWLAIAVGGKESLVDLGEIYNDGTMPRLEKLEASVKVLGGQALQIAKFGLGYYVAGLVAPRATAALGAVSTGLLASQALIAVSKGNVPALSKIQMAWAGEAQPLDAMRFWQSGISPEATFLKVDPENPSGFWGSVGAFLGENPNKDVNALEGGHSTPRADFWIGPDSPFTRRLLQLYGPGKSLSDLRAHPETLDLSRVKAFEEPIYPTVELLQRFPALAQKHPELGQLPFDYGTFQAKVKATQAAAARWLPHPEKPDARVLSLDPEPLIELWRELDPQDWVNSKERDALDRRLELDARAALSWLTLLSSLEIPQEDKERALSQYLENVASVHAANTALRRYAKQNGRHFYGLDSDANADDFYTLAPRFLKEAKAR